MRSSSRCRISRSGRSARSACSSAPRSTSGSAPSTRSSYRIFIGSLGNGICCCWQSAHPCSLRVAAAWVEYGVDWSYQFLRPVLVIDGFARLDWGRWFKWSYQQEGAQWVLKARPRSLIRWPNGSSG
ncbi:exported protein of unknown function [Pseudomonas sp. JV551A1]|uniref:Uncharacterized protein n=1 Tax=Pseudomonas inefficax TaxID=2078786 RepID=A0AAQ1P7Z6_9PSED|nr:exported protein of unknown function [Pseudomonas sp. JV551A1]SPO60839.1 exported protein of unknown function [Pseudomonas inefficax]